MKIEIKDVAVRFGPVRALGGVDLTLHPGGVTDTAPLMTAPDFLDSRDG